MKGAATLSTDDLHRFELTREWSSDPMDARGAMTFVMLNPSTADATEDDPTIRRCVGFARAAGFTRLRVVNLYSLRTPEPAVLWRSPLRDRVRIENDDHLAAAATEIATVGGVAVAAWGAGAPTAGANLADHRARIDRVHEIFERDLWCYGTTANGSPKHPLYLPGASALERWTA